MYGLRVTDGHALPAQWRSYRDRQKLLITVDGICDTRAAVHTTINAACGIALP
jgi:hypothetical protein